jgi:hypothetical protein
MPARGAGRDAGDGRQREEAVRRLTSGVQLDGDQEAVYSAVDDEQASGDGLYVADIVDATGLPEERVRDAVAALVEQEVLTAGTSDPDLGARYVRGRAA